MPDVPNPITALGGAVGSSIAEAAASAFNTAMKSVWDFAVTLLGGVFAVVDHLSTPDLDPRTGPLASVLPATLWVGGTLLVILSLIQVGKAAMSGGTGLLHLFKGIAQYVVVTACGLGLLAGFVTAANAAALGILSSGLHVDSWAGIASANSAWQNAVNAVSGSGLGLIALLGVIPAAISLLVTALVREAAILVIAATIPIVAAGLVAEATARWFWTALRWLLALVLLTPTVAIVMAVGLQLAAGAAGGTQTAGQTAGTDAGQSAVTALVAAAVLLVSVFCPLALFKLFAFVDPATPSGQRLRTSMADTSSAGTAASSTGTTRQESDTREQVESRWTQALGRVSEAHRVLGGAAQSAMSSAAPVLAAAGVGEGTDPDPTPGSRRGGGSTRGADSSTGSTGPTGSNGQEQDPPPSDPPTAEPPTPPDVIPPPPSPPTDQGPGPGGSGAPGASGGTPPAPPAGGGPAGAAGGSEAAAVAAL